MVESFFQKSSINLKPFCYSSFMKDMAEQEWFVVGGNVAEIVGRPKGIFVGNQVIAFVTDNELKETGAVQLNLERVFPVPQNIALEDAVAVTKYLCQINAIRECEAPLCSTYQLSKPDQVFKALLDAMGYIQSNDGNIDFWVDLDNSLVGKSFPKSCYVLLWSLLFSEGRVLPGADWEMAKSRDGKKTKYPDAYIKTKISDNIALYFDLVEKGRLKPDTSDVQILLECNNNNAEEIQKELGLFQPYEGLIENRVKPLIGVYVIDKRNKETTDLIREVDSWIGFEHSVCKESPERIKLGYPDGSVVDIMYTEGQTKHIELHFNGISIIHKDGTTQKF